MIITIDGPSGTGKTTIAKKVAEALDLPYFDTGAMYRAVTLLFLEEGITADHKAQIEKILVDFQFQIIRKESQVLYLVNESDVTEQIRSQRVTQNVSWVSALPQVRESLWRIQKRFAQQEGGVFEGRDMGSVVFPDAFCKIFVDARPEVRAQRRLNELISKRPEEARNFNEQEMKEELERRDALDSSRTLAPLKCPKDAYIIDTSDLSIDDVVKRILSFYHKKTSKKPSLLYRFVLLVTRTFMIILYRHKVYGTEHFYSQGAIIAANHTSFLDPPILAISCPEEVHFLARKTLFKNRFFGALISALNTHPVEGGAGNLTVFKTVIHLLKSGKKVIMFPEGTRSSTGELAPLKSGVSLLAVRTEKAIIPTYIDGSFEIWGKGRSFPKLWGRTRCVFGKPILWDSVKHLGKKEAQEELSLRLTSSLLNLKEWLKEGAQGTPP